MPEYGMALGFVGPWDVDEPLARMITNSLEHNFEATKEMNPTWGLPDWAKVEIKKREPPEPARETLPCEHGADERGDPLFDECKVEDCEGYVRGPIIPGKFEHAWAWYVNVNRPPSPVAT